MIDRELLAQVRRIQVRTSRMVTSVLAGGYTSVFRGSGIEFDEVREFTEGDDVRSVDWNVTARTGRPHVKRFVEERELTVLFVLDLSASMRFGSVAKADGRHLAVREAAATFLGCLAIAAARNDDKAGLVAFSDRIELHVPARKGIGHVSRLIREALAREPLGQGSDLAKALEHVARVQRKRAVMFVISDFLAGDFLRPLRLLGKKHDVVLVPIVDPRTRELPARGLVLVRDLETDASRWVDAGSGRVRAAHAKNVAAWRERLQETGKRGGADLLWLELPAIKTASKDLLARVVADAIVGFFRRRELKGAYG